ncbi:MAG: hypothetical protein JW888_06950 [Pirellulales bacterium]|nr:hypothetical protein [Pirellulales bacterium]
MKRPIARWLISRSIDDPTCAIPAWVERAMERDASLREYQRRSQQLARQLEQDAPGWIAAAPPATRPASHVRRSTGRITLAASLAAGLLIAIGLWQGIPGTHQSAQTPAESELPPIDLESLADSWNSGRRTVARLSQHAEDVAAALLNPPAPRLAVDLREPVASAGVAYGQTLALLDREMEQERDRIASDLRGTIRFFTHELPSQVAHPKKASPP